MFFTRFFRKKKEEIIEDKMKFLIFGLGNIGEEYAFTRHNIGFDVLDEFAKSKEVTFEQAKYCFKTEVRIKGRTVILVKPTTYMNLSGKAVKHWMEKEGVKKENILVVTDDINIELGKMRLKTLGSHGGHNGLRNIEEQIFTREYPRLRIGAAGNFPKGRQVEFVLGKWDTKEETEIEILKKEACDAIESFVFHGTANTMNKFNR